MEAHKITTVRKDVNPYLDHLDHNGRKKTVALEGLEDLFNWASDVVATEDIQVKPSQIERIRRQVMSAVQSLKEQEALVRVNQENAYLNRRLMAIYQKLQESTEQNAMLKQIMVAQTFMLERIPSPEEEIKRLRSLELDVQAAKAELNELLNTLSKLKIERDHLDEMLRANEEENTRLARILSTVRAELEQMKAKKWWQFWKH